MDSVNDEFCYTYQPSLVREGEFMRRSWVIRLLDFCHLCGEHLQLHSV